MDGEYVAAKQGSFFSELKDPSRSNWALSDENAEKTQHSSIQRTHTSSEISLTIANNPPISRPDELNQQLDAWLRRIGLEFNPFVPLEAGADSRLSTYLVGHDAFATLWGDWPACLFASAGGGKSAFRVRLAYACRAGEDGQRVFPILYHLPRGPLSFETHLHEISRAAAHELLLELAWRPGWFEELDAAKRREIRRALDWNAPHLLDQLLPQLQEAGSPLPIVVNYDPSAAHLPNPPAPARVRALCDALQFQPTTVETPPPPQERFNHLIQVTSLLKHQAVYILVDSVDAYPETVHAPTTALSWLRPLFDHLAGWGEQRVFPKFFLPIELENLLKNEPKLLTSQTKSANIKWTPERLIEMLQVRVQAASEGEFKSLDAISNPALQRVEETLVAEVPPNPRELLRLARQVLIEHVSQAPPADLLVPQDLEKAIDFYQSHNIEP